MSSEDFRRAFDLYDINHDGVISSSELKGVLISFGYHASDQDLKDIVADLDSNRNGVIDYPEFLRLMETHPAKVGEEMRAEDIVEAFRAFDKDGNGVITAAEIKVSMEAMGQKLTDAEVQDMIREADVNGDGLINYEEFARMMLRS